VKLERSPPMRKEVNIDAHSFAEALNTGILEFRIF
jgi:hypothetical protein